MILFHTQGDMYLEGFDVPRHDVTWHETRKAAQAYIDAHRWWVNAVTGEHTPPEIIEVHVQPTRSFLVRLLNHYAGA